jgi:hypothetical protein
MRASKKLVLLKAIWCLAFFGLVLTGAFGPVAEAAGTCDLGSFTGLGLPNTEFTIPPLPAAYAVNSPGVSPKTSPVNHCEVIGYINPRTGIDGKLYAIGFRLRLPDAWNGKFYFQGGGGTDGSLANTAPGDGPLSLGYAVVSTDAGHDDKIDSDPNAGDTAAFGVDPQARIDYGYHALDVVTQTAKSIIQSYYAKAIDYSYFVGCSNGGRQGMIASQRFPTYFDGIVIGAPGFNLPKAAVAEAWNEQALAPLATSLSLQGQPYLVDTFSDADLLLAGNAILAACDALDGLADGIVANPGACTNNLVYPELQKVQCIGAKTPTCLSADQITALKKIYAGPKNSHEKPLYVDWQWDAGISAFTSLRMWSLGFTPPPINSAFNLTLGGGSLPHVFMTPPDVTPLTGLEAYIFNFNFDTDAPRIFKTSWPYTESSMQFMTAHSTNLWPFRHHGSKMILYHGSSDGVFSSHDTVNWYEEMNEAMHGRAKDFARLFLVPGMGHCGAGPGTTQFDVFTPLVTWVEDKSGSSAPDMIVATAPSLGTPWPGRTRPLCPYPEVAAYDGSGGSEVAASFTCVPPIEVRIEPETLNLKSKGEFTAFITLPEGYHVRDWNIHNVTCEGVPAVKGMIAGNTFIAKFNRQDLKNVAPGKGVILTVKATFQHNGKQALIEGTDTVRAIK